jgi:hypothetical protein
MTKSKPAPRAQGDLTFVPIARLPQGATVARAKSGQYILALGEATGHLHALLAHPDVEVFTGTDGEDTAVATDVYLRLKSRAEILHTKGGTATHEHDTLVIEPGIYHVVRQYAYVFQAVVRVAD